MDKEMIEKYGPFEYLGAQREHEMGMISPDISWQDTVTLPNGAIYTGQWRKSKDESVREGRGMLVWLDGTLYEGYFKNDKASMYGRLLHKDGELYQGEWLDDKAHGFGFYYRFDGSMYRGFWKNDQQSGKGVEHWPNGDKFEGIYRDGQKEGLGTFSWSDGNRYHGNFVANNIEG